MENNISVFIEQPTYNESAPCNCFKHSFVYLIKKFVFFLEAHYGIELTQNENQYFSFYEMADEYAIIILKILLLFQKEFHTFKLWDLVTLETYTDVYHKMELEKDITLIRDRECIFCQ